jgi:hypothetical protein
MISQSIGFERVDQTSLFLDTESLWNRWPTNNGLKMVDAEERYDAWMTVFAFMNS